jgi:predicted pyridoxine 5'-phosphate oxidase superfamily flavin-nucleotide-binding protein
MATYPSVAYTDAVRAAQVRLGSPLGRRATDTDTAAGGLGPDERAFVEARDGFYQATVSATGWPYVQYRGGPAGFVRAIDGRTIGYADLRGNRQYISVGNLAGDDRVALFFMDYATRSRLKIFGRARIVEDPDDERPVRSPPSPTAAMWSGPS